MGTLSQPKEKGTQPVGERFRQSRVTTRLALGGAALAVLLAGAMLVSLSVGPVEIPPGHVLSVLLDRLGLGGATHTETERLVLEQLRLPRILVGALVGMGLGVAGATMQGLFRNPMARSEEHNV